MKLTTIIPAYRQEQTIVEDVTNIERALQSTGLDYELLVVVDGFVDKTFDILNNLYCSSANVRVLGYPNNGGKGQAVRYGMRAATGDLVAFIDAGMDINPDGIGQAVCKMRATNAAIVIGSKRHPQSQVSYPPLRRLYSAFYQILVWLLFGLSIRDTQVGLKLFRCEVLEDIEPLLLVKRFAFDVEILVVAGLMGHHHVEEIPVSLTHNRFASTIRARSICEMLWDTAAIFYRVRILRYYQRQALKHYLPRRLSQKKEVQEGANEPVITC